MAEAEEVSEEDYMRIIEAAGGNVEAKRLAARRIPKYFKLFPTLSVQAIDRHLTLCRDDDLEVRVQAIIGLPLLCEDTPKYVSKFVNLLDQLPPAGEYVEREAIHKSLIKILQQVMENYKMHQEEEDLHDVPPSVVNPADSGKNVDISLTSQLKIGVIDSGCSETLTSQDLKCFARTPISKSYHSCEAPAGISSHGFACASLISGRRRNVKFFGVCDKEIQGVVPDAQLYTYAAGCQNCKPSVVFIRAAIDAAIQDGVKVISMSLGPLYRSKVTCPQNDLTGLKLLDVCDKVLVCAPIGNEGPLEGTVVNGMPWILNVGGCTGGEILVTDVEIAIATSENIPLGVQILDRQEDREGEFFIIDRIHILIQTKG